MTSRSGDLMDSFLEVFRKVLGHTPLQTGSCQPRIARKSHHLQMILNLPDVDGAAHMREEVLVGAISTPTRSPGRWPMGASRQTSAADLDSHCQQF
mgnify:CR=1 FL=1